MSAWSRCFVAPVVVVTGVWALLWAARGFGPEPGPQNVQEVIEIAGQRGLYCTGDEVCSAAMECVTVARDCNDGVACTHDPCDESGKRCTHVPHDALCPVSHACDAASSSSTAGVASVEPSSTSTASAPSSRAITSRPSAPTTSAITAASV